MIYLIEEFIQLFLFNRFSLVVFAVNGIESIVGFKKQIVDQQDMWFINDQKNENYRGDG